LLPIFFESRKPDIRRACSAQEEDELPKGAHPPKVVVKKGR